MVFFRQELNQFTGAIIATACLITQIFCVFTIAVFKVKYYAEEKKIRYWNSLGRIHPISNINETLPHKSDCGLPDNTDDNNEPKNSTILNTISGLLQGNQKMIINTDGNDEESKDVKIIKSRKRALPDIEATLSSTSENNEEFHDGSVLNTRNQLDTTIKTRSVNGNDDTSNDVVTLNDKHMILTRLRPVTCDGNQPNNIVISNPENQWIRLNTHAYNKVLIEVYQMTFITFAIAISLTTLRVKQRLLKDGIGFLEEYPKPLLCFLDIAAQFLVSIILPLTIHIHNPEILKYIKAHFL